MNVTAPLVVNEQLEIEIEHLVDEYMDQIQTTIEFDTGDVYLAWIERLSNQKGIGAEFLRRLQELCEEFKVSLLLRVDENKPKLCDFYMELGFCEIEISNGMIKMQF